MDVWHSKTSFLLREKKIAEDQALMHCSPTSTNGANAQKILSYAPRQRPFTCRVGIGVTAQLFDPALVELADVDLP